MFETINEISVLVSAILALAVGSIWYSPLVFGDVWMRVTGLTEEKMEEARERMPLFVFFAFLANLVIFFVIAHIIELAEAAGESLLRLGILLVLLLSSLMMSAVIWEERPLSYVLINAGYVAVVIFAGIGVISYWPW